TLGHDLAGRGRVDDQRRAAELADGRRLVRLGAGRAALADVDVGADAGDRLAGQRRQVLDRDLVDLPVAGRDLLAEAAVRALHRRRAGRKLEARAAPTAG